MRAIHPPQAIGTKRRKLGLYSTVSVAGLSLVLGASPALAQIHATGSARISNVTGSASAQLNNSDANPTIQVTAPQAIIDWTPTDNEFLPAGTTATFYSLTSSNYTVLNVIASGTTPMRFDGSIVSKINGPSGSIGGNVWFYSPGGIIVGATGTFNVGSLLLTTLNPDPADLPGQNFTSFNDGTTIAGTIGLRTDTGIYAGDNTSQINIASGASISAQNYVGLVAPRIVQSGNIAAGGAIGLVAAEQVDLTIESSGGLFAISVPVGGGTSYEGNTTADAAVVQNGGSVGTDASGNGIASTASGARQAYMVAVPKNTAVTMLLAGSAIGYGATSASAGTDGVVVLAGAGMSTSFSSPTSPSHTQPTSSTNTGTVLIGSAGTTSDMLFSSNLDVAASNIDAEALDANLTFAGTTILNGGLSSLLGANQTIVANGDLTVASQLYGQSGADQVGGNAQVVVSGTLRLDPAKTLTIDASSKGVDGSDGFTNGGSGGNVIGSAASMTLADGTVEGLTSGTTGGTIHILATGTGGAGYFNGGSGRGGAASLVMNGGSVDTDSLEIIADGIGGRSFASPGAAYGGSASVVMITSDSSPRLHSNSDILITANATAGSALTDSDYYDGSGNLDTAPGTAGAAATAGIVSFTMNSASGTVQTTTLQLSANAVGGNGGIAAGPVDGGPYTDGGAGGSGTGGSTSLTITGGDVSAFQIALTSNGTGGNGGDARTDDYGQFSGTGNGGVGGVGQAGTARVQFLSGSRILDGSSGASLLLAGVATGGNGGFSEDAVQGSGGAALSNGLSDGINLDLEQNSQITRGSIVLSGVAIGGTGASSDFTGGTGGAATASATSVTASNGGSQIGAFALTLDSSASGGAGGGGSGDSAGGDAHGSSATIDFSGGSISVVNATTLTASAQGGQGGGSSGGSLGTSTAGTAQIRAAGATLALGTANLYADANDAAFVGDFGASAIGGTVSLIAQDTGSIQAPNGFFLTSTANGGGGFLTAGNGQGGAISLLADTGGSITATAPSQLNSSAIGGGTNSGIGGAGIGGGQTITAQTGSSISLDSLTLSATGSGGSGSGGGNGAGGPVQILADGSAFSTTSDLTIQTDGTAGSALMTDNSPVGTGGSASLTSHSGTFTIGGSLNIETNGDGATGQAGDIMIAKSGGAVGVASGVAINTTLRSDAPGTPGNITITNTVAGTIDPLDFGAINIDASSDAPVSGRGVTVSTISNRITASSIEISTSGNLTFASNTGGIYADAPNAYVIATAAGLTTIQGNGLDPTIQTGTLDLDYYDLSSIGGVLSAVGTGSSGTIRVSGYNDLTIDGLSATNGIILQSGGNIIIGRASVTGAPASNPDGGGIDPYVAYFQATAGSYEGQYGSRTSDSSITVAGSVTAAGNIDLNASDSINVLATGLVRSDNGISLTAGHDVLNAGTISGGRSPFDTSSGFVNIDASDDDSGTFVAHSLINSGLISAGAGSLQIYADAIQGLGGTFAGDTITVGLNAGSTSDNDGGLLDPRCLTGTICLGSITAQTAFAIDTQYRLPDSVWLSGAISAPSLTVQAANGIRLGTTGTAADILIGGPALLDAGAGAITSETGSTGTVSGASVKLIGASLATPGHSFQAAAGDLTLDVNGPIRAFGFAAAGRLGHTVSGNFVNGLTLANSFTATDHLSVLGGDVLLSGPSITIGSLSTPDNVSLISTTGGVTVTADLVAGGLVTVVGSSVSLTSIGDLSLDTVSAGPIGLYLNAGGQLTIANGASGADAILISRTAGITAQTLSTTGPTSFSATGAVSVADLLTPGRVSADVGSLQVASTGSLTFANAIARSGDVTIATQGDLAVNAGRAAGAASFTTPGTLTLGNYTSATDFILSALQLPTFGNIAARNISLTALASDLTGGVLIASGTTTLSTPGKLTITDLRSAGGATLSGGTIDVGSTIALNVLRATAGDGGLRLRSGGTLTVANASSTAGIDLASTAGDVTLGTITMTGTPTIGRDAAAGTSAFTVAAAGTTTLNGDVTGAGAATISGTNLVLNGLIDASGISLASQTIAVGPSALIGTLARTGTVSFTNSGTGRSFIGGTGSATGYSLNAAALSRIQASSVTLALPKTSTSSTTTPDVVIGSFTLYGTGAAAPSGARQNLGTGLIAISTPGQVQVNGAVLLANLPANGSGGLSIRAAGIDVVTPSGSIIQTTASGAPGGTLDLDARIVRVASASALANLANLATPTSREARLSLNDGNVSDAGWLTANTIRFDDPSGIASGSGIAAIYVQNSGGATASARRGITTGTGGVIIADFPSTDQPEVFINGRGTNADGTAQTGSDFLASISQTGSGGGTVLVNGCVLSSGVCSNTGAASSFIAQLAPPQDLVAVISNGSDDDDKDEDSTKPGDPVPTKDPQSLVQFQQPNPEQQSQSSDDPVIGAGNDGLWTGGGAVGGGAGGASSFDTIIGVGNDAGSPNNDRPGAGGNAGNGGPGQPGDRGAVGNPTAEGGLGIGNDAPGQRGGAGNGATGTSGPGTPSAPTGPNGAPNDGGLLGIGGDANAPGGPGAPGAGSTRPSTTAKPGN